MLTPPCSTLMLDELGRSLKIRPLEFVVDDENFYEGPYTGVYGDEISPFTCCKQFDNHFNPFENESRAFGRLEEVGREDLAVKVYGYVALHFTDIIVQKLEAAKVNMSYPPEKVEWIFGRDEEMDDDSPVMRIVKDWIDGVECYDQEMREVYPIVVQVRHFPRMLEGVHDLHKHGIVDRGLSSRQYVNGTLVDLSLASTVPHPFSPDPDPVGSKEWWQPRWTFWSLAAMDPHCFKVDVIDNWHENLAIFPEARPGAKGIKKTCEDSEPTAFPAPQYDPLDYAKHTPVTKNVKKRETRRPTGQGVKKRIAKGKQVKSKRGNKTENKSKPRASGLGGKAAK
ncbi:pectate lyase c [Fusarium beomiforme]|uniref:Pectate lyase c n=1 Tax=Fusarium beomiforme TaxID=44412 RepID=A0A9P5ALM2_9HYPO|nr:pectate lyase c [Fusarium beomiforme]